MTTLDDTEQVFNPGATIAGRYVVDAVLGEGGMGRVLRATETRLGRTVALKVLHGRLARDGEERQRFLREARLTASLSHPNVLEVYEADVWEDHLYIAMEYVDGGNLAGLLDGGLPLAPGLDVLAKVAQALAAAHGAGLIHRDLKPENVLVSALVSSAEGMMVKVADWGLARAIEAPQRLTATGVVLGTPAYMPPEQIRGEHLGPAVDCYALGIILFRLVAGRLPFPGPTLGKFLEGHLRLEPPALTSVRHGCPSALADLVSALLTKDQSRRLSDAGEVALRLSDIGAGLRTSPVADLPTHAVSSVRAAHSVPTPGKPARGQLRSRAGRDLGSSSAEAPTTALQSSPSLDDDGGRVASSMGGEGEPVQRGAPRAPRRQGNSRPPRTAGASLAPGAKAGPRPAAAPTTAPPHRGPGLRGAVALLALVIVTGLALRHVATGSSPAFVVHGMRLADIDSITVVGVGEPPPGATLRVIPEDASAPFDVPLSVEGTNVPGDASGRRTWTVPLGRLLLTKARVEVHGPSLEGPDRPTASIGPGDLPPLACLMRLDDDAALVSLIEELHEPTRDRGTALADAGLTSATLGWLVGRLPRLVPPQAAPPAPVRRLLLPLVCLETLRSSTDTWLPDWRAALSRFGYPDQALRSDLDENFHRPLPPVILGRAVVQSMKQGPRDAQPKLRMTWVHSPEQAAAARANPEYYITTTDQYVAWTNAASASVDDWQPERRLSLPLDGSIWPPVRPVMVLDARYHTHDRILLITVNGSTPYMVVRPGSISIEAEHAVYSDTAHRYLVPLDPADLRQGSNEVVLRSRILRRPLPFHGTRVEGLAVVDDRNDALRGVVFHPRSPRNTGFEKASGTDRPGP